MKRKSADTFQRRQVAAAVQRLQAALEHAAPRLRKHAPSPSRRGFLQTGMAAGLAAGLPLLAGCGGGDDKDSGSGGGASRQTLFFNYTHLDHAGKAMSIQMGQKTYRLKPIAEAPDVLTRERQTNRFLAAVPDQHITHVIEDVPLADGVAAFYYGVTDAANGQWTMDSVNIVLPQSATVAAYDRALAKNGGNTPLPVSAKRRKYGAPAATSAQDLHEEQALQDTVSHAASLVTMHKDMLALDATAAQTVVHSHVMQSIGVLDLDVQLAALGTASPETSPGVQNATGWATLRPLLDANNNPRRINAPGDPANGRIVYMPVLHPTMSLLVASAVNEVLPQVQNDISLGADVTAKPAGASLRGVLWARSDGRPTIDQSPGALAASAVPTMAVNWTNGSNHWLECDASLTSPGDGTQQVTFAYTNTGLRYLGCFIEFLDEAGNPIEMGTMPGWSDGTWVSDPPNFQYSVSGDADKTRLSTGVVTSLGTVMGIPVFTDAKFYGGFGMTFRMPNTVSRVRLYAGGLGVGSNNYPDTLAGGVAATIFVNYVMTTLFATLGAIPDMDLLFGLVTAGGAALIYAIAGGVIDSTSGNSFLTPQFWIDQGFNLLNLLIGMVTSANDPLLKAFGAGLAGLIGEAVVESAIEKAIPVVGIVLNIEAALAGYADVELTTVTIAQSPFTYVTDLVLTHDVSVTINCDPGNSSFPRGANLMTVIATFDDGKPHRQDLPVPAATSTTSVVFRGVPFGGGVELAVAFAERALDGSVADNILLGHGTTGRQANDDKTATYAITIVEIPFPVSQTTRYKHIQRSYLNGAGQHVWVVGPQPAAPPPQFQCGTAGQVCQFNGITVRQGTPNSPQMLGYAWRGQPPAGGGDVFQLAVMNADTPSAGYAIATSPPTGGGLDIGFSRQAGGTDNFYVDTSSGKGIIRGITLDGAGSPVIDGPTSNRAYGMLNLSSDALLLHPQGYLVSISGSNDRIETLMPPKAPVTDAQAEQMYIATVSGGNGSRPGLINGVTGATITKDGTLLLLEQGNNRIQAMDLGINPVRYFAKAPTPYLLPLAELPLDQGWRHLDIQADFTGLLYLLSFNTGSGVYRLSIYDQLTTLQNAISVTDGVIAARIGLDHWRDLYTLNFEPIVVQGSGTKPALTEPSVSLWTPCALGVTCQ